MIHIFAIHKQKIAKENPAADNRHGVGKGIMYYSASAALNVSSNFGNWIAKKSTISSFCAQ